MQIINNIGKYLQTGRAWYNRDPATIKKITVHHDAIPHDGKSAHQVMELIKTTHSNNGWPGASYHYFIHRDGTVYQMNDHKWVTWHDGQNWDSIGIVLTGWFHEPHNNRPTAQQKQSLFRLLDKLKADLKLTNADILGHRDRMATACPGSLGYPLIAEYKTVPPANPAYTLDTDIPSEVEDKHGLKEVKRYNKHWTFTQLIEDWVVMSRLVDTLNGQIVILKNDKDKLTALNNDLEASSKIQDKNLETKISEIVKLETQISQLKGYKSENEILTSNLKRTTSENATLIKDLKEVNEIVETQKKAYQTVSDALKALLESMEGLFKGLEAKDMPEALENLENILEENRRARTDSRRQLHEYTVKQKLLSILLDVLAYAGVK